MRFLEHKIKDRQNLMDKVLRRIKKMFYLFLTFAVRPFTRVKKNCIVCWSYDFKQYSCNPRYIAEYLAKNHVDEFEVYWVQKKGTDISNVYDGIQLVRPYSFRFCILINTAGFVVTNARTNYLTDFFFKRKGQVYIQTWHGFLPLKKIEKDAEKVLPSRYLFNAKRDSRMCDLMLSGCQYSTDNIRAAFWYDGEILEKGMPRCEVLFNQNQSIKGKILDLYHLPDSAKLLLYAPTFRVDKSMDHYIFDWKAMLPILNERFGGNFYILFRLHPNIMDESNSLRELFPKEFIVDVTRYPDMQELLATADILVTDYSSSMFEAGICHKPCFLYTPDSAEYDRGFYFNMNDLPFPMAKSQDELIYHIENYNEIAYSHRLDEFNRFIGAVKNPQDANKELYLWMSSAKIHSSN